MRSLLSLWPGLTQLWLHGRLSGLATALVYSIVANALLVATFWRPQLLSPWIILAAWPVFIAAWFLAIRLPFHGKRNIKGAELDDSRLSDHYFHDAQLAYLGKRWAEALELVESAISSEPGDVEARLLHVAILRRTGFPDEARTALGKIESWDRASYWSYEILCERKALEESSPSDSDESSEAERNDDLHEESEPSTESMGRTQVAHHEIASYDSSVQGAHGQSDSDPSSSDEPDKSDSSTETSDGTHSHRLSNERQSGNNSITSSSNDAEDSSDQASRHAA